MDIELFDKRYVYLEWSDKLEGKDCILAKSYQDLKDFVNSGNEDRIFKVDKGKEKPFTNHWRECDFCYYDPNYRVKKAWLEGKTIQYYSSFNKWKDLSLITTGNTKNYIDWDNYEWRIKPTMKEYKKYTTRRMTNRELSEYLAKGNGEMKMDFYSPNFSEFISTVYTSYTYAEGTENDEIGIINHIHIRDFGSDKWREPLIEI